MKLSEALLKWNRGATARGHKGKFYREENIRPLDELLRHFDDETTVEEVGACRDCGLTEVVKIVPAKEMKRSPFLVMVGV